MKSYCALGSVYGGDDPAHFELALHSVINQTTKVPICLVVDGPISAELEEIVERYRNEFYSVIRLSKNLGLGLALKEALETLTTSFDFAIRFDSDDINLKNRFEVLIDAIELNDFDLVGSYIYECQGDYLNDVVGTRIVPQDNASIVKRMPIRNPFNHPSVAFRIQSVISVGSYENIPYFEDWYLWAKMVSNGLVVGNLDQALVKFRFDTDMLMRRQGLSYLKNEINFYNKLRKLNIYKPGPLFAIALFRVSCRILPYRLFKNIYFILRRYF